ncbi:MAG: hypothetical protein Q9M28_06495 [Mariprofundaceae bacterium]|nr:hypothetical protein [Mariprofundaceae bacterium]
MSIFSKSKLTPQQAFEGLKMFADVAKENHKVTEEESTKRQSITAMKEFEIAKIQAQKEVLKDYFEKTFAERRINFDKMFEALDKGIESNNLELIQFSLGSIVEIAKDSPLAQVEKLRSDFYNPEVKSIEI